MFVDSALAIAVVSDRKTTLSLSLPQRQILCVQVYLVTVQFRISSETLRSVLNRVSRIALSLSPNLSDIFGLFSSLLPALNLEN